VKLSDLTDNYRAEYFRDAFARFVVGFQNPDFSKRQVEAAAADYFLPFQSVSVYHKIKFWNEDPLGRENAGDALDAVHVKPGYTNKHGRRIGGRFDTVMANDGTGEHTGIKGTIAELSPCRVLILGTINQDIVLDVSARYFPFQNVC
jgi:hypothetical protein